MGCNKSRFYVDVMCLNEEVTGSCHLCVVKTPDGETIKFIVDCGLFQETAYRKYNESFPFNPAELDFALITHNHTDHIGRLSLLSKLGFKNTIYTTELTKILMPASLRDSYGIAQRDAKRDDVKPLYDEEDLNNTLELIKGFPYFTEIQVHENVKVTFLDNGHLPGAALILVKISYYGEEDINMLFTGDYSKHSAFFDVQPIPKYVFDIPLTVIQEATYATTYTDSILKVFEENILKAVKEGKTIVIPVFAQGRCQELMLKLKNMQDSGMLDVNIPIFLDGSLCMTYTAIYEGFSYLFKDEAKKFCPANFKYVDKKNRAALLVTTTCKIILTSSGMGSHGPAPMYIGNFISSEKALVHFVGYPAMRTLSRKLKDAEKGEEVKVGSLMKSKICDIEYTTEFSSHAKLDEMLDFLKQFSNIKLLLVNHGEYECKDNFAKEAVKNDLAKGVAVESRATFHRIGRYGLLKEITTKFS